MNHVVGNVTEQKRAVEDCCRSQLHLLCHPTRDVGSEAFEPK